MIDTVFLDAGGVFLLPRHDDVVPLLERAGVGAVEPERLDRAHYAAVATIDATVATYVDDEIWPTYLPAYLRAVGVPDDRLDEVAPRVDAGWSEVGWSRVIAESARALRELASTGVRLAVVSNSNGTVASLLSEGGVCQEGPGSGVEVATVVDSSVVGVAKPDPGIFEIALERTGAERGRSVHVGDCVRSDVDGARAAGIRPLHLDPHGMCPEPDDHDHIGSLGDVLGLVESVSR